MGIQALLTRELLTRELLIRELLTLALLIRVLLTLAPLTLAPPIQALTVALGTVIQPVRNRERIHRRLTVERETAIQLVLSRGLTVARATVTRLAVSLVARRLRMRMAMGLVTSREILMSVFSCPVSSHCAMISRQKLWTTLVLLMTKVLTWRSMAASNTSKSPKIVWPKSVCKQPPAFKSLLTISAFALVWMARSTMNTRLASIRSFTLKM